MMKSSTQIRFDFQNAKQQADQLDELASNLEQQVLRQMFDANQQLRIAWTGESANRFVIKQNELQEKIRSTIRALREIADEIRRIAKRVYDAEMQAYYIASQRHNSFSSDGGGDGSFGAGGGNGGGSGGGGGRGGRNSGGGVGGGRSY